MSGFVYARFGLMNATAVFLEGSWSSASRTTAMILLYHTLMIC